MRILHVIESLGCTSAARQLGMLARHLPAEFEQEVCELSRAGDLSDLNGSGMRSQSAGRAWKIDPRAGVALRRISAVCDPQLVHLWDAPSAWYAAASGALVGKRVVLSARRLAFSGGRFLSRFARLAGANSVRVLAGCELVGRRWQADRAGLPVAVVNDAAQAAGQRESLPSPLAELDLPPDARLIVAAGPLESRKRLKDLIWAADLLKCVRDDAYLLIAGSGVHLERLCRYREQVQITDKVRFLGPRRDLPEILPHADVFWLAEGEAGTSTALLEASLAAVPAVAADTAATRRLIAHGETGYRVPTGDRAAFARWTSLLLDDVGLASSVGRSAALRLPASHRPEVMAAGYAEHYRDSLA